MSLQVEGTIPYQYYRFKFLFKRVESARIVVMSMALSVIKSSLMVIFILMLWLVSKNYYYYYYYL